MTYFSTILYTHENVSDFIIYSSTAVLSQKIHKTFPAVVAVVVQILCKQGDNSLMSALQT